jgi:hypothetical protein
MFISILTIFSQSLEIARGYLLNLLLGRVEQGLSKFKVPAGGQQKQPGILYIYLGVMTSGNDRWMELDSSMGHSGSLSNADDGLKHYLH